MSPLRFSPYLHLIRLPNIFTVPSNVMVGYLALHSGPANQLAGLIASSVLLYVSGIVFNDCFDFEHDRKNRPNRPLPSGRISKRNALAIAILTMSVGNAIAVATAGLGALFVTLSLSAIILAYDYRLKSYEVAGTAAMAGARSLNVVLGASPAIPVWLSFSAGGFISEYGLQTLAVAATSIFLFIVSIMILSRTEERGASGTRKRISLGIIIATIGYVALAGYLIGWPYWFFLTLGLFACVVALTFRRHYSQSAESTQKIIRNLVLSLIILDSVFITASAGIVYGLATLLLLVPAVALARKMYVT